MDKNDLQDLRRRELLRKFQSGDKIAGEIFAQENFPMVIEAINKYHKNIEVFSFEEKVAIGNVGFSHAMNNYNVDGEQKFSTYAYKCINGRVLTALRDYREVSFSRRDQETLRAIKKGKLSKAEIMKKFDINDYDYGMLERTSIYTISIDNSMRENNGMNSSTSANKENVYAEFLVDERESFEKAKTEIEFFDMISKLTEKEQMVLTEILYHGFTQTELSKRLGKSQASVSRAYNKALDKLRRIYLEAERGTTNE